MKRLFFLFALALSSLAAMAESYTVYYDNSGTNWSSVYVWIWNNTTGTNYTGGSAPQAMTSQGNNLYSYTFTTTEDVSSNVGILFCNSSTWSGSQTSDFTFVAGETYDNNGLINAIHYTHSVYFDNSSSNWSNPHCWIWDDNGNYTGNGSDDADGEPMSLVDGSTTLYYYEFTTTTETLTNPYVIFSADANWGSQTANLVFVDGATYDTNGVISSSGEGEGETTTYEYTVYFDNLNNWSTVKIWTWGGSTVYYNGTALTDFDNRPTMTYDSNIDLWYITVSSNSALTGVKFDDGNNESDGDSGFEQVDETIPNNEVFTPSGDSGYTVDNYTRSSSGEGEGEGEGETTEGENYTFWFDKSVGNASTWTTVQLYWFYTSNGTTAQGDSWHDSTNGTMNYDDDSGLYYITIANANLYTGLTLIFDDGESETGVVGTTQTDDITDIVNNGVYTINGYSGYTKDEYSSNSGEG
ncbi:MAG: starch-binding protein, partial [Prevotella sp.]|nr:starch-binding protein [Prevotella sp.]